MDSPTPCLSFIGIVDFSQEVCPNLARLFSPNDLPYNEARWLFMTDSVTDLLGYEPSELYGRPSLELVHPDEFGRVRQLHYDTITADKAAVLVYLRMKHKDPYKGYILCGVSRTVVHNVLVGSVSFASPGAKALHNASTAQEITVISPDASGFQFRRWNDPSPMPPSPELSHNAPQRSPSPPPRSSMAWSPTSPAPDPLPRRNEKTMTFSHLPSQSFRTALILDRFSLNCTILYISNDLLLSSSVTMGRSFYDFVSKKDEDVVRSWIDVVKGWGVNERGQPSDGGFGFGRFTLLAEGRESVARVPDPPSRHHRHREGSGQPFKTRSAKSSSRPQPVRLRSQTQSSAGDDTEQIVVDAIFSAHSDGLMVILRRAA